MKIYQANVGIGVAPLELWMNTINYFLQRYRPEWGLAQVHYKSLNQVEGYQSFEILFTKRNQIIEDCQPCGN